MPKRVWIIASVLSALVVALFIGFTVWQDGHDAEVLKKQLDEARLAAARSEATASELKEKLAGLEARAEELRQELEQEKQEATHARQGLEDEMRAALESKDVTISQLQGKLTVNILDRVMFDSGEAELRGEGETVLRKVAAVLTQHTNLTIHVVGHTDNVPIRANSRSRFASNWELSTGRALAAVRFLTEKAGVDPRRIGAVGYGEFRPIADNSTPEGRARNRRIAITVLPDELVGADASAKATTGVALPKAAPNTANNFPPEAPLLPESPAATAK